MSFFALTKLFIIIVIFYYDFILTLPQEIKHIWSSKFNKVNLLVIALRYTTAIGYIPVLVLTFAPTFAEQVSELLMLAHYVDSNLITLLPP